MADSSCEDARRPTALWEWHTRAVCARPVFCRRCDVVLDLHYGEDDCDGAGLRADVLNAGDRLMGHVPFGGTGQS